MRRLPLLPALVLTLSGWGLGLCQAQTSSINPTADTFVSSANPANNYGSAGGLAVSASDLSNGEFDSTVLFNLASTKAAFDATYGVGQWTIQSITLGLNATDPGNPIYDGSDTDTSTAGNFTITWMQNTSWVEGTGNPRTNSTVGLTYNNLPNYLSSADQSLGTFTYDGSPDGYNSDYDTYTLGLSSGLTGCVYSGSNVSLELTPADSVINYIFHSRNYTSGDYPVLTITVIAGAPPTTSAPVEEPTMPLAGLAALALLLLLAGARLLPSPDGSARREGL